MTLDLGFRSRTHPHDEQCAGEVPCSVLHVVSARPAKQSIPGRACNLVGHFAAAPLMAWGALQATRTVAADVAQLRTSYRFPARPHPAGPSSLWEQVCFWTMPPCCSCVPCPLTRPPLRIRGAIMLPLPHSWQAWSVVGRTAAGLDEGLERAGLLGRLEPPRRMTPEEEAHVAEVRASASCSAWLSVCLLEGGRARTLARTAPARGADPRQAGAAEAERRGRGAGAGAPPGRCRRRPPASGARLAGAALRGAGVGLGQPLRPQAHPKVRREAQRNGSSCSHLAASCLTRACAIVAERPCRFFVLETVARIPYFASMSVLHLYESLGLWRAGADLRKLHFAEE